MTKASKRKAKQSNANPKKKRDDNVVREDAPAWGIAQRKRRTGSVALDRKYAVTNVSDAKAIARNWLTSCKLENAVSFGLPEVDDRYHVWRVPFVNQANNQRVGELVLDAYTSMVLVEETTRPEVIESRLLGRTASQDGKTGQAAKPIPTQASFVRNTVIFGDC
jgi:hypothetical protein